MFEQLLNLSLTMVIFRVKGGVYGIRFDNENDEDENPAEG